LKMFTSRSEHFRKDHFGKLNL